jgi:methylated-DNA-[protein]-cysteine S-methyltransferase
MKIPHDALVAMLLGDAPASPALARWLATDAGRRELAAYRRTLAALDRVVGDTPAKRPADEASRAGGRPVYYCALPSPIGRLFVAASEAGLMRVSFQQPERAFIEQLRRAGIEPVRSRARTADVVHQLRAYFAGERRAFDIRVDLSGISPFQRDVLMAAASIPAGEVVSYGEIARRIGRPGGSRAVGQALGHNPIPIVIPCHRVIAAGGQIGGYGGGLARKRRLLRLEGARAVGG